MSFQRDTELLDREIARQLALLAQRQELEGRRGIVVGIALEFLLLDVVQKAGKVSRAAIAAIHAQANTTAIQKPMTLQAWPDPVAMPTKAAKKITPVTTKLVI